MNKGNKVVELLQTLFLISNPFSSVLPKKVTSCQKFLPFLRFFTVYCTLHFNLKNTFKINVKKRKNGRNFWYEVTFLGKMEEKGSEIKKRVYNTCTILFPLFIFKNKIFFSATPRPLYKRIFMSVLACFRNFCNGSTLGGLVINATCRWEKKFFFSNTLKIDVFKSKARIRKTSLEKKIFKFYFRLFWLKKQQSKFSKGPTPRFEQRT